MPTKSPAKGGKLPKKAMPRARVAYQDADSGTYIWPDKVDSRSTPVAILPCATKAQAARICRVANMNWRDRQELVANVIDAYNDITNAGETWSAGAEAMAVLNALGLGGEATR